MRSTRRSLRRATATMAGTIESLPRKWVPANLNLSQTFGSVIYDRPDPIPTEVWTHVADATLTGKHIQLRGLVMDVPEGATIAMRNADGSTLGVGTAGHGGHLALEGTGIIPKATRHHPATLSVWTIDNGHSLDGTFVIESFLVRKTARLPSFEFSPTVSNRGTTLDFTSNDPIIPPIDPGGGTSTQLYSFDSLQLVVEITHPVQVMSISGYAPANAGQQMDLYVVLPGETDVGSSLGSTIVGSDGRYTINLTSPMWLQSGNYFFQARYWGTHYEGGTPVAVEYNGLLDTIFRDGPTVWRTTI